MNKQRIPRKASEEAPRAVSSGDIGRLTAVAVFASFAAQVSHADSANWIENPDPELSVAPWVGNATEEYVFTLPPPPPPPDFISFCVGGDPPDDVTCGDPPDDATCGTPDGNTDNGKCVDIACGSSCSNSDD